MLDSIQSLLDAFPEGVIQTRAGLVLAANEKARHYLPQLTPGAPLPVVLPLPALGEAESGTFQCNGTSYSYSCKASGVEQVILFRPEVLSALEGWQLDGTLRQLRELLGDVLAEVGAAFPAEETPAAFNKTFHRLFRLIGNLEFMRQTTEAGGVPFHPVTMELDSLCWEVTCQAGDLLREAGVTLKYAYKNEGRKLFIPGDRTLLKKLLLGLISNAARAAGEGVVAITLSRQGDQARILVSGSGISDERQLTALFQSGPGQGLPLPGQGAGLGMPIARHIVQLHGGTLLPYGGDSALGVLVSLPTGPLDSRTSLRTPTVQLDGGLDPVLVELSDVLPASLFGMEGLD